jgi:predicted peptidase
MDSAVKIDDPQADKKLKKYFRNPKNREKWPDDLFEKDMTQSSSSNSDTSNQNNSPIIITAKEDRRKGRKGRWEKNREHWDNI